MVNVEFVAGISAGAVTTLVMHPLDLIKVRLQVDDYHPFPSGSGNIQNAKPSMTGKVARILKSFTSYKDLYRGLRVNLVGNTVSWGLYFALYNELKRTLIIPSQNLDSRIQTNSEEEDNINIPISLPQFSNQHLYLGCALIAGTTTSFLTNPLWVLKTRLLGTSRSGVAGQVPATLSNIIRTEGLRALWRGFVPSLFGVMQGSLQFTIYEDLKQRRLQYHETLPIVEYLSISATSKIIATVMLYPYQLVRSRMQMPITSSKSSSSSSTVSASSGVRALDVLRTTIRTEGGIFALYKGLGANLLRVVPSTCITFLVYEKVLHFMNQEKKQY